MKNWTKCLKGFAGMLVAATALGAVSLAQAGLISVRLSDGVTTVTCADGDACDGSSAAGVVSFSGSVGSWLANVTTAVSYPALGSADVARLDLNSINVSSSGAGTLTIEASQTDYTGPIVGGTVSRGFSAGGTTDGSVDFDFYLDDGNTLFGTGALLGSLGPFSGGTNFAFSGSGGGSAAATGTFGLTALASVTHTASGSSSFNAAIPEPSTLLLMGAGLIALGFLARRERRRQVLAA